MTDPQIFFWIVASTADIPDDNSNGMKRLLANGLITLFINGKLAVINDLRKLRRRIPSGLAIFLVFPFNKIPLFTKFL